MAALPTRATLAGTPSKAATQALLLEWYDFDAEKLGSDAGAAPVTVASATTVDLDAVTTVRDIVISGTTTITGFTIGRGKAFRVRASGAFTLTNNSAIVTNRGANIVCAAGDSFVLRATAVDVVEVLLFTTIKPFQSVRAHTPNGYGSTNTNIRRFTTVATNEGTDITYADSAADGASFTINADGIYAVSYTEQFTGPAWFGPTLNATTALNATAAANVLAAGYTTSVANTGQSASWIGRLSASDVVRPATDGVAAGVSGYNTMTVARVA